MNNVLENIRYDAKNWWLFLITGLLSIVAGVFIFARPATGYVSLSILFSVVMIVSGFSQIFFSTANSNVLKGWGWILVSGILDVAIGTYLFTYPLITMATLPFFVGFWLVIRAFYLMGFSFDLKDLNVSGWGWILFGGLVVLACALGIIYYPAAGVVSIVAVSGSAFIVGGFMNIYLAFQLKNVKREAERIEQTVGRIKKDYSHA